MGNAIDIGKIAETIARELKNYTQEVADGVKSAVDTTAKELLKNTRADAPKRTGHYKKAIKTKKRYEDNYEKRVTWYVDDPYYRLSHLLENPHDIKRDGIVIGRTKAHPHIEDNREKALADFEERVKEVIRNAGK